MAALSVETQVADSQAIQGLLDTALSQGTPDHYPGKRGWTRFNVGLPCELTKDPTMAHSEWFVTLHNVSGGGFACWSKTRLGVRARVFVREFSAEQPGVWIPATVCHCTSGLRGYLIGAAFENPLNSTPSGGSASFEAAARPPRSVLRPSPAALAFRAVPTGPQSRSAVNSGHRPAPC